MILTLLMLASAQQVQLSPSQDLTLQPGAPVFAGNVNGNGNRGAQDCDNFNRADGPMGAAWTVISGSETIVSSYGIGSGTMAYMTSNTANCAASASTVSIVFRPSNGTLKYVAAMTGFPGASNGYFSKIQDQSGGMYSNIGFYQGNNGGGYGGFWGITPVAWGRMDVSYDAASDSMRMDIDEFDDCSIDYTYYSNSGASGVGGLAGTGHGVGTYNDQQYDNWEVNDGCGGCGGCGAPVLTKTGTCPGPMKVQATCCTPGGKVVFLYGNAGAWTKPNGICSGVTLAISNPTLAASRLADGSGSYSLSFNAPPGVCGKTVQVVDVTTCTPSNTITL